MITFKKYNRAPSPNEVTAICYSGTMQDAEDLESLYKGKVRLEFRGIFTGCLYIKNHGQPGDTLNPGDYLVDSPDFGLFSLSPGLFGEYYKEIK